MQNMECAEYFSPKEPGLMKVAFKLSEICAAWKLSYDDECLDLIYDYLLIFMRSFIRAMVEENRKFKIVDCPPLLIEPKVPEEPKMGNVWEMDILWNRMSKELIESVQKNDETKPKKKQKDGKHGDSDKEHKAGKYTHITGQVKTECVYSRFTVNDLLHLLKVNPFSIPKSRIRYILKMSAMGKKKPSSPFCKIDQPCLEETNALGGVQQPCLKETDALGGVQQPCLKETNALGGVQKSVLGS